MTDPSDLHQPSARLRDAAGAVGETSDTDRTHTGGASPLPRLDVPSTWGHLSLVEELGAGAYGRVYRAWDAVLARDVALKIIRADRADPSTAAAILREGQMLARVRHRNVVTVYGAQQIGSEFGFWMELIRGRPLTRMIQDDGPMGAEEAAVIGISLCDALAAVHAAGLLHRDVKAQNVMREAGGRIVLMDFGAGRDLLGGPQAVGELAGTPLYMAPEVLTGGAWTPAADVYSLGVLLYFLVSGRYPVEGRSLTDIALAYAGGHQRLLTDLRPGLPETFVRVVGRATALAPMRYRTAGALMRDLAEVVPGAVGSWRERIAEDTAHVRGDERPSAAVRDTRAAPVRLALVVGAAAAFIWLLGFLNTMAFNQAFGRTGAYADDSVVDLLIWGLRSLVGPALYVVLLFLALGLVRFLWRMLTTVVRPLGDAVSRLRARALDALGLRGERRRTLAAQWLLALQVVSVAILCWLCRDLIAAYTTFLDTAPASAIEALRNNDGHVLYRWAFSGLLVAMALGWYRVLRTPGPPIDRMTVAAGFGIIAIVVGLLDVPFRLVYQSNFPRADLNGRRCYVTGETAGRVLLFCPDQPPRTHVVPASDPGLRRLTTVESAFTPAASPAR